MVMNRRAIVQWVVYPIALAILMGCIVFSLVGLLGLIRASWALYFLVPICGAAAMEAYWTGRLVERLQPGSYVTAWHVRAVELVGWYVALQIVSDIRSRHAPFENGLPYWGGGTAAQFVLVVICWLSALDSARDFYRLSDVRPHIVLDFSPVERLTARFFRGGGFLLLFTGLSTVPAHDLQRVDTLSLPTVSGIIYNVLLYFAVGTILLVQIRYESLARTWSLRGIAVSAGIPTRWLRYSVVLLGIGVLAATVLPTDFTGGVLDVVAGLATALSIVLGILTFAVLIPLTKLLSLLHVAGTAAHHPPAPPHVPHSTPSGGHPLDGLTILRSLLFWASVIAAVVYLARTYLSVLPRSGPGGLLRAVLLAAGGFCRSVWRRIRRVRVRGRVPVLRRSGHARGSIAPIPQRRRTLFPWLLPPREQIIWYYIGLIQRAGKRGFPRQTGQTPNEFDGALAPHLTEARDDLRALTQAYIEARYSPRTPTTQQARAVRTTWGRVLAGLRRVR